MKWLLAFTGLLHISRQRDGLMERVRTASDEHAVEVKNANARVEEVIFQTKVSTVLSSIDQSADDDRRRAIDELLHQKGQRNAWFR